MAVPTSTKVRLLVGWLLVGIALSYGVYQTVLKAAKLFTS